MITSVPTPPTDSIYKFTAFLGLIAVVASVGCLLLIADRENRILQQEDKLDNRSQLATDIAKMFVDKPDLVTEGTSKRATDALDEAKKANDELRNMRDDHRADKDMFLRLRTVSLLGLMIGSILMFGGLYLWITKVQLPADRLLRYQLIETQQKAIAAIAANKAAAKPVDENPQPNRVE